MERCQIKQGFFFLRDCDEPAVATCPRCNRQVCKKHSKIVDGSSAPVCLDCIGKDMQSKRSGRNGRWSNYWDDDYYYGAAWGYGSRSSYYSRNHYSPWYDGDRYDNNGYYDSYDVRSFNDRNDSAADDFDNNDTKAESDIFDS